MKAKSAKKRVKGAKSAQERQNHTHSLAPLVPLGSASRKSAEQEQVPSTSKGRESPTPKTPTPCELSGFYSS
jgi:hypothetical protein